MPSRFLLIALLAGCRLAPSDPEQPAPSASLSITVVPAPGSISTPVASIELAPVSSAAPPENECGEGMVKIWKTCVDAYEAHLVVTREDGRVEPWPHFQRPPADLRYEARSEAGRYPQGYISRVEAAKACKNAGKRLCSLGEWRRACQGKRWLLYGYGPKARHGYCNSGKDHLLSKLYGNNGRAWKYDEHFNNPELNQMAGFLAKSGEYTACTAGEGVYDMVGNLHEWVSDTLDEALMERLEKDRVERRKQPMREGNGLFVGGFFSTTNELGPGCMYVTAAHEPSYHDYSTGFRCCKNAPDSPSPLRKKR